MKHLLLVLLIANTLSAETASAQAPGRHDVFGRYQQLVWNERDGLPQNTVVAIAATRDGYLWLGTYEGAARFDGVRFRLFNASTTTGIGNSFVTSLLERRDGDLWLATYGGGVSRLSGGRFTQYTMRDGLSSDYIWCLLEDPAGTLKPVLSFLELPQWEPDPSKIVPKRRNKGQYKEGMAPATRERLEEYFEPHNRRLYDYLGVDLGW